MTVAEAVRAQLLTMVPVTSLVSARVYLVKLPQHLATFPAIRVQRIGENEDMHLRGSAGIKVARVQVDSVAMEGSGVDVYASASAVDEAVNGPGDGTGLLGFAGVIGSPAFVVHGVFPAGMREGYDPDELRQFKIMRDFEVHFTD